jgi:hypothetical protein
MVAVQNPESLFARLLFSSVGYGYTASIAWFVLWLSGGWSSEARIIDRLGRLLGWCWIASFVIQPVLQW